jgi:hypothetical protein
MINCTGYMNCGIGSGSCQVVGFCTGDVEPQPQVSETHIIVTYTCVVKERPQDTIGVAT